MTTIKNFIALIVVTFVALIGIRFCAYGLIVSLTGSSLHEISISDIQPKNLKFKRYIEITDATSINSPLQYTDEKGEVKYYLYPLFNRQDSIMDLKTNIILQSEHQIHNWQEVKIQGLLKPYWYKINTNIIAKYRFKNIKIEPQNYYLVLDSKPLKWYWYLLILAVIFLFFYRMIEALIKGIKKNKHQKLKEKNNKFL